jgi:hypothetical protein
VYLDLIAAAGAKYSSDPAIVAVNMAAFANHDSNDWNIQNTIGTNIDVAAQCWRRLRDSSPPPGAVGLQIVHKLWKRLLQHLHLRFHSITLRTLREIV